MKAVLATILVLYSACCFAQDKSLDNPENFVLTGDITGRDTGIIVLWYPNANGEYVRDTASVKKGKFDFKGKLVAPAFCWLHGSKKNGNTTSFYLEPGEQHLLVEEDKFSSLIMTGSFTQKQEDSLKTYTTAIETKYKNWIEEHAKLVQQLKDEKDSLTKLKIEDKIRIIERRNQVIDSARLNETLLFISRHPDSYVSPTHLYGILTNRQLETKTAEGLYNKFSNIKKIPELKSYLEAYGPENLAIVNISIDKDSSAWIQAIKKYGINHFYNLLSNKDIDDKYTNTSQPIPSEILINKEGIIIWNSMNQTSRGLGETLKKEIRE